MSTEKSTDELFGLALTQDREDDPYSETLAALWQRPDAETFATAYALCKSDTWQHRVVGANVLSQLGTYSKPRTEPANEETLSLLLGMASDAANSEPELVDAIVNALCHQNDPRANNAIIPFRNHPYWHVRWNIACHLSKIDNERAVPPLIEMTDDEDEAVRDWATFGLGSIIEADSPDIREALVRRLSDEDEPTRREAIKGLLERKEDRGLKALQHELASGTATDLMREVALEFAHPSLLPALLEVKRNDLGEDIEDESLDEAIAKCRLE